MKNIFLIQTPKLGRLVLRDADNKLVLRTPITQWHGVSQNIYITNDDKIKEGDWCLDINGKIFKHENHFPISIGQRKIIITTDPELIEDGVQVIDDTFLKWFINNPTCEYVEVEDFPTTEKYNSKGEYIHNSNWIYKIIIPQR